MYVHQVEKAASAQWHTGCHSFQLSLSQRGPFSKDINVIIKVQLKSLSRDNRIVFKAFLQVTVFSTEFA